MKKGIPSCLSACFSSFTFQLKASTHATLCQENLSSDIFRVIACHLTGHCVRRCTFQPQLLVRAPCRSVQRSIEMREHGQSRRRAKRGPWQSVLQWQQRREVQSPSPSCTIAPTMSRRNSAKTECGSVFPSKASWHTSLVASVGS